MIVTAPAFTVLIKRIGCVDDAKTVESPAVPACPGALSLLRERDRFALPLRRSPGASGGHALESAYRCFPSNRAGKT